MSRANRRRRGQTEEPFLVRSRLPSINEGMPGRAQAAYPPYILIFRRSSDTLMSLTADGRYIHCDGEHCPACIPATRAFNAPLDAASKKNPGWLFVQKNERVWHYCPDHVRVYLQQHLST